MVVFENFNEIQTWLKKRSRREVTVFAARAALRSLPMLSAEYPMQAAPDRDSMFARNLLAAFRMVAAAWAHARFPRQTELLMDAANRAVMFDISFTTASISSAACAANRAMSNAARLAARANEFAAVDARGAAEGAAAAAFYAINAPNNRWGGEFIGIDAQSVTQRGIYAEFHADATTLDSHVAPSELASRELWLNGQPEWATLQWSTLRGLLVALDEDWAVWTDWYEDRLRGDAQATAEGRPVLESFEIERLLVPDETWWKGPRIVNEQMRRLETKFRGS